jgi:hypothetical protein
MFLSSMTCKRHLLKTFLSIFQLQEAVVMFCCGAASFYTEFWSSSVVSGSYTQTTVLYSKYSKLKLVKQLNVLRMKVFFPIL